ncbi:MAG TPA: hypothetical protein VJ775_06020 [Sphingomicrobium sp.]|nr:hypothetical protein [Sphingomicrobium sp.]
MPRSTKAYIPYLLPHEAARVGDIEQRLAALKAERRKIVSRGNCRRRYELGGSDER